MPKLLLTHRAEQDLAALPRAIQEAVVETLRLLEDDPEGTGKQLRGRLRGMWSCRVGSYMILYTIEGSKARQRVIVRAIRHRGVRSASRPTLTVTDLIRAPVGPFRWSRSNGTANPSRFDLATDAWAVSAVLERRRVRGSHGSSW